MSTGSGRTDGSQGLQRSAEASAEVIQFIRRPPERVFPDRARGREKKSCRAIIAVTASAWQTRLTGVGVADFLAELLQMGLTDIYLIDKGVPIEEKSGSEYETVSQSFVAKRERSFVKVTTEFHANRYSSYRAHVGKPEAITVDQYAELSVGKPMIDTPQARARVKVEEEKELQRIAAREKLESMAPKCAKCKVKKSARSGQYGPFWSCHVCGTTSNMQAATKTLFNQSL